MIILNKRSGFFIFYIFLLLINCSKEQDNNNSNNNNSTSSNNTIGDGNNNSNSNITANVYKFNFKDSECNYQNIDILENHCIDLTSLNSSNNNNSNSEVNVNNTCPFKSINLIPGIDNEIIIQAYSNINCTDIFINETLVCNNNNNTSNNSNIEYFQYFDVKCLNYDNETSSDSDSDESGGNDNSTTLPPIIYPLNSTFVVSFKYPCIKKKIKVPLNICIAIPDAASNTSSSTLSSTLSSSSSSSTSSSTTIGSYEPTSSSTTIGSYEPTATTTTTTTSGEIPSNPTSGETPTNPTSGYTTSTTSTETTTTEDTSGYQPNTVFEITKAVLLTKSGKDATCNYRSIKIVPDIGNSKKIQLYNESDCSNTPTYSYNIVCSTERTDNDVFNVTCPSSNSGSTDSSNDDPNYHPVKHTILSQSYSSASSNSSRNNNNTSSNSNSTIGSCDFHIQFIFPNCDFILKSANYSTLIINETIDSKPNYFIKYTIPNIKTAPINLLVFVKDNITYSPQFSNLICTEAPSKIYLSPRFKFIYPYKQYFPTFENDIIQSTTQLQQREIQGSYYSFILETTYESHFILNRTFKFLSPDVEVITFKDFKNDKRIPYAFTQTLVIFRLISPTEFINSTIDDQDDDFDPITKIKLITLQIEFPSNGYLQNQYFKLYNPFIYSNSSGYDIEAYQNLGTDSMLNSYSTFDIRVIDISNDENSNSNGNGFSFNSFCTPRMRVNGIDSNTIYPLSGTNEYLNYYGIANQNKFISLSSNTESTTNDIQIYTYEYTKILNITEEIILPPPETTIPSINSSSSNGSTNDTSIVDDTDNNSTFTGDFISNIDETNDVDYLYSSIIIDIINITQYINNSIGGNDNNSTRVKITEYREPELNNSNNNTAAQILMIKFGLNTTQQLLSVKLQPWDNLISLYPYGFSYRNPINPNIVNYTISKLIPHYTKDELDIKISKISQIIPSVNIQVLKDSNETIVDYKIKNLTCDINIGISNWNCDSGRRRIFDNKAPNLLSVSIRNIDFMNAVLHIEAMDLESGISMIKIGEIIKFTSSDLTKGSVFNGSFEKYLNYFNLTNYNEITLIDNVGNTKTIPYQINWPISEPGTIRDIDFKLKTTSNDSNGDDFTNIEQNGYLYTVILKYKIDNNSNYMLFTPGFQFFINNDVSSRFKKSPFYSLMKWNSEIGGYTTDFYLPSYLFNSQVIQYQIMSSGNIYDTSAMVSFLGYEKAIFKAILQNKFDLAPPIVQSIKRIPENGILNYNTTTVNSNNNQFGWEIQFKDTSGFQSGNITFTSEFDLIGYSYFFTLKDSRDGIDENQSDPTFIWKIKMDNIPVNANVTNKLICKSQTYRISSLSLLGMDGHYSSTLNDLSGYINPMAWLGFDISDIDKHSIKIVCPSPTSTTLVLSNNTIYYTSQNDITPPRLTNFKTSVSSIDVGSFNRTVSASFKLEDYESGLSTRLLPIVYLENSRGDKIGFKASLMELAGGSHSGWYSVIIDVPFGFGIPDGLILSVYGITDNVLNIAGYSSLDLDNYNSDGKRYSFIQTTYLPSPIISKASYNPVTNTPLTIFGHNLQSQLSENQKIRVEIDFGYGFITQETQFVSGLLLTIYPTNTTSPKFIIKVIVDGIESNKFLVTPFIPDSSNNDNPFSCPNECGGPSNGECDTNIGCKCNTGYAGADCTSSPISLEPPKVNLLAPSILLETNNRISSLIKVVGINEIDEIGSVYRQYLFVDGKWKFSNRSNAMSPYHYSYIYSFATDDGLVTNLTASLRWYDSQPNTILDVSFADLNYRVNPSSIKYSFILSKYSFKNDQSYLQLLLDTSIESSSHTDICSCKEFGADSIGSEYVKLQVNGQALYGRFLQRSLINNKITKSTNSLLSNVKTDLPYKSDAIIGINIPYYITKAILDPDFTVFLETTPASSKSYRTCTNFGLTKAQISAIIASVAIFVIAIISLTIIFVVRKYKKGHISICSSKIKSKSIKSKKSGKIKLERLN